MKVLWLLPRRPRGAPSGGDLYDAQVVAGLRKLGHRVQVTSTLPEPKAVRADVVVQDALGFARFLRFNRALERAGCKARRVALVHVTTARLSPAGGTAQREAQYLASTHAAVFVSRQARAESLRLLRRSVEPASPQLEHLLSELRAGRTGVVWPAPRPLAQGEDRSPGAPEPERAERGERLGRGASMQRMPAMGLVPPSAAPTARMQEPGSPALSAPLAAQLARASRGLRSMKTAVIPPGADRLKPLRRKAPPRAHEPLRLLCVGHLLPHKGQLALLDAFAAALPKLNATLVLAGSGERDRRYASKVLARLRALPQARWVGALGPAALARALSEADVFLNASDYESWGMAAAEAQAAGLPVLSWSSGGLWEFLTPGEDSLRLRAPSLSRLATPGLVARLKRGAQRAARRRRTWEATSRAFADFLSQLTPPAAPLR